MIGGVVPVVFGAADALLEAIGIEGGISAVGRAGVAVAQDAIDAAFLAKRTGALKPCEYPDERVPCFTPPKGADTDEFDRQLQEQEDEINKTDPDELTKRIDEYNSSLRNPAAQQAAREEYRISREDELTQQYLNAGKSLQEAEAAAEADTEAQMDDLDATHALDMIAGGDPSKISGLGDSSINRSIGSQWKSRVSALRDAAKQAGAAGQKKMNVKLKRCK